MDEDEANALDEFAAEVEEHLYAKIHHGQVEGGLRVELGKKTPPERQKERNMRYFAAQRGGGKPWAKGFGQKRPPVLGLDVEKTAEITRPAVKFTPYSSILTEMNMSGNTNVSGSAQNLRKNPANLVRKVLEVMKTSPTTAAKTKKKNRKKKKVQTIVLESSEGEEEDDDVVEIPVPPPPLVCIDSSDEEPPVTPQKAPQIVKPHQRVSSSPSSSIFSDDFIAAKDRVRLRESAETVHVDEELRGVQQARSPQKRMRNPPPPPRITSADIEIRQLPVSDISTSDSEDFLQDGGEETPKRRFQKRKKLPPSPKEIPFIRRGEALPNADNLPKRKSIDTASSSAPRSDDEFMTILSTIAHGESSNSSHPALEENPPAQEVSSTTNDEPEDAEDPIEIEDDEDDEDSVQESDELLLNINTQQDDSSSECLAESLPRSPQEDPPDRVIGWNDEMHKFYDESWGGENFSITKILNEMPADRSQWKISPKDYNSRYHRRSRELLETKLVCYMCGQKGHREPRCPNTLCLKCGNRTQVFGFACAKCADWNSKICGTCNTAGHKEDLCPDNWRRYHSTTEDGPPVEDSVEYSGRKWCSVCARSGHTADTCLYPVRVLEYPATSWKISSYAGVYGGKEAPPNPPDPFQTHRGARVKFNWSEGVKKSQFYRRFREHCYPEEGERVEVEPVKDVRDFREENVIEEPVIAIDHTDTKIFLHRDFCKDLLSPRGQAFLKELADRLMVEVNLRTSKTGNLLRLIGGQEAVEEFKKNLHKFLSPVKRVSETPEDISLACQIVPRNRIKLINFLKMKMRELAEYIGNAPNLYAEMKNNEGVRSGFRRQRQAERARTQLNMILMGQAGLREGRMHLKALEADLRMLERLQQESEVPDTVRNSIYLHFKYIFTDHRHGNYEDLLRQFHSLKSANKLPLLAMPRHQNNPNNFRHQRKKPRYFRNLIIS